MYFDNSMIKKPVPAWITNRTRENMDVYNMGLADSFSEAVRNYPGLVKGSELWAAWYYDDFRKYIPSAYIPESLNFKKRPLAYAGKYNKPLVIHRGDTYIKFVSNRETTANRAGDILEAWKDCAGWHLFNPAENKRYSCFADTLRAIAGEVLEQDARQLPPSWKLAH